MFDLLIMNLNNLERILKILCANNCKMNKFDLKNQVLCDDFEEILNNTTIFENVENTVKARSPIDICSNFLSKNNCDPDKLCNKLHICKYFVVGGKCAFSNKKLSKKNATCNFGHDLFTEHNSRILKEHNIGNLSEDDFKILMKSSLTVLPQICKYYNCHTRCNKGDSCLALHVCRYYVLGDCRFGHKNCKRNHDILNKQCKELLKLYNISVHRSPKEVLDEIKHFYIKTDKCNEHYESSNSLGNFNRNFLKPRCSSSGINNRRKNENKSQKNHPESNNTSESDNDSTDSEDNSDSDCSSTSSCYAPVYLSDEEENSQNNQNVGKTFLNSINKNSDASSYNVIENATSDSSVIICVHFLLNKCAFGKNCSKIHSSVPYQWQWKDKIRWTNFPSSTNIDIEKQFCNKTKDKYTFKLEFNGWYVYCYFFNGE